VIVSTEPRRSLALLSAIELQCNARAVAASLCLPRRSSPKAGRGVTARSERRQSAVATALSELDVERWTFGRRPPVQFADRNPARIKLLVEENDETVLISTHDAQATDSQSR
jgi:hypothetical protein